ncbi:MAG: class I SAM-dependent methyltransferase [Haliea sp.]|jgi:SAM-dependent methyltransferase|nr:class I SAM-dependent methyltransferase [Haliea sp.]
MNRKNTYIHALKFQKLNGLYDPLVRLSTREQTVKTALVDTLSGHSGKVLDLACGSGTLAVLIKQRYPHLTVRGVDGDPEMLSRAERKATAAGVDIDFSHGFADALPFDAGSFDVVVSSLFLHHLSRAGKTSAFSEIKRVLSPTGELMVADWGRPQNLLMRAAFFPVRLLDGMENTRDNVRGDLPLLIGASGFSRVDTLGNIATPLGTISILTAVSNCAEAETPPTVACSVERREMLS